MLAGGDEAFFVFQMFSRLTGAPTKALGLGALKERYQCDAQQRINSNQQPKISGRLGFRNHFSGDSGFGKNHALADGINRVNRNDKYYCFKHK
ncbi:MAG: hypothetical protein ABIP02_08645 [Arenimonas sp.]